MLRTLCLVLASALLAGCSGLGFVNAVTRDTGYELRSGVAYGELDRQRLDVYLPQPASAVGPRPLVVFFYGGSWQWGDREEYEFAGRALTEMGAVAVVPDYRVHPQVVFPAFVDDAAAATAWALEHAEELGADPERVFVMGHSAGAHLAALVAADARYLEAAGHHPRELAGLVGLAGPYDFLPLTSDDLKRVFPEPTRDASQPVAFVDGDEPPALLLHGTADDVAWPRNSRSLARELEAAGVPVELHLLDGVGHGRILAALAPPLRRLAPEVADEVREFIRRGAERSAAANPSSSPASRTPWRASRSRSSAPRGARTRR